LGVSLERVKEGASKVPGAARSAFSLDSSFQKPLKEQLARNAVRHRTIARYFQFDSPARVCFLSISSAAGLKFLHGLHELASGTSNRKAALES
jgi:hypothetical protein